MHGIYVKSFKLGLSLSFFLFLANVFFYLRRRKVCQNEKVKWLNAHLSIHRNSISNKLFYKKVVEKSFYRLRHRLHKKKSQSGIGIFRIDWDFLLPYHNTMEVLKNRFLPYIYFFFQENPLSLFQLILENLYHLDSDSHYLILLMTRIILRTKKLFTKT